MYILTRTSYSLLLGGDSSSVLAHQTEGENELPSCETWMSQGFGQGAECRQGLQIAGHVPVASMQQGASSIRCRAHHGAMPDGLIRWLLAQTFHSSASGTFVLLLVP